MRSSFSTAYIYLFQKCGLTIPARIPTKTGQSIPFFLLAIYRRVTSLILILRSLGHLQLLFKCLRSFALISQFSQFWQQRKALRRRGSWSQLVTLLRASSGWLHVPQRFVSISPFLISISENKIISARTHAIKESTSRPSFLRARRPKSMIVDLILSLAFFVGKRWTKYSKFSPTVL